MTVLFFYTAFALGVAGVLALVRMERGPGMLDRVVGLDVVTAAVLGSVGLVSVWADRTDLIPVLVVLSVVGFVGAVTISRFIVVETSEEARILTSEELAALAERSTSLDDDDAPVHDPDALPAVTGEDDRLDSDPRVVGDAGAIDAAPDDTRHPADGGEAR